MKVTTVSSIEDAISKALGAFAQGEEFVLCEGDTTVGGVMFAAQGTLLLHRSKRGMWLSSAPTETELEYAQERLRKEG